MSVGELMIYIDACSDRAHRSGAKLTRLRLPRTAHDLMWNFMCQLGELVGPGPNGTMLVGVRRGHPIYYTGIVLEVGE